MSEIASSEKSSTGSYARLSVNINDETAAALRTLADRDGVTITELIRRAVSVLAFVEGEIDKGNEIRVVDKRRGTVSELVLLDPVTDKKQKSAREDLTGHDAPVEREVIRIGPTLPVPTEPRKPFWLRVQMFIVAHWPQDNAVGRMPLPMPHPGHSVGYQRRVRAWEESHRRADSR